MMSTEPGFGALDLNEAHAEVARLEARIAKAASDSEAWRASYQQEQYLASFVMMEALEAQLCAVHARIAAMNTGSGRPQ